VQQLIKRSRAIMELDKVDSYAALDQALSERAAPHVQRQAGENVYAGFFAQDQTSIAETANNDQAIADDVKNHVGNNLALKPLSLPIGTISLCKTIPTMARRSSTFRGQRRTS